MYFMMENTALTMTYASNVGIIVACAPFFVAVMVGIFFKSERPGRNFFIGFVIAITGIILISLNGQKSLNLNPAGDFLAFLAMISWGLYSATVKKIEEWNLLLWNYFSDSGAYFAACDVGYGRIETTGSDFQFSVPRCRCKCCWIFPLEFINKMDWSRQDQCIYLCFPCRDGSIINVCIG